MVSATVRDIAIILVAVEILVMNGLLVVLIWQVWRLVKMIKVEMKPVIKDSQETVGTVKRLSRICQHKFHKPPDSNKQQAGRNLALCAGDQVGIEKFDGRDYAAKTEDHPRR